ncbi:MAG: N-acetylneuraminate synthase, partial [Haliea sp.]
MTVRRVLVIAEAGVNHNGDLSMALALCDAAHAAGADAVKFQTFRAEDLVLPGAPTALYQARQTGQQDQYELLRQLELSETAHRTIMAHCQGIGIEFFSTPFSVGAVDLLVGLGVKRLKLSSGELTHRALVEHAAATGLPLLISTGMGTMEEIREALQWAAAARGHLEGVTVLHCTSAYPATDEALNLTAMVSMGRDLGVAIGY